MSDELLRKLYEVRYVLSDKVECIERHHRTKYGIREMERTNKSCDWGRKRGGATTCGDCPFGRSFLEPKPVYDSKEIIKQLKEERQKEVAFG